ncbi:hypothetical protein BDW59DRAFT_167692 [Aspergillus cavernicola]|uniref:Uncharacterized protein n=1 Tax=Aspergillus cavernicola TaxID=176166 RepID=A0ABR4HBT9_9EURO
MDSIETRAQPTPQSFPTSTRAQYVEKPGDSDALEKKQSAFKDLGILDRFLVIWVFLAMEMDQVFLKWLSPWSLIGLLFMILVLSAFDRDFSTIFFATFFVAYKLGFGYRLAATQSFTAASNNFELAIVVSVATFGANSTPDSGIYCGPVD